MEAYGHLSLSFSHAGAVAPLLARLGLPRHRGASTVCAGVAVTLPRSGRGGGLWKTREQEELPGILQDFCRGEHSKRKALKCTQQAGDVVSWCWGPGHAPKGCVCIVCAVHHAQYAIHLMLCIMHCVLCSVCCTYLVLCAMYSVLSTLCSAPCVVCCIFCAEQRVLCNVCCAMCAEYQVLCNMCCALSIRCCATCAVQRVLCAARSALRSECCALPPATTRGSPHTEYCKLSCSCIFLCTPISTV